MENKNFRPDVRIEPTLYSVLRAYCQQYDVKVSTLTRQLYVEFLTEKGFLKPEHIRAMKGM